MSPAPTSGRRVARNTGAYLGGELVNRVATVALFAVMARELGREGFGDFTFAISLVVLLAIAAGLSTDEIVTRAVARDVRELDRLLWSALALKAGGGLVVVLVACGVAALGAYGAAVAAAIVLVAVAGLFDLLADTTYAVFQGLEDFRPLAIGRIVQGVTRATAGIAVLLAGGSLLAVACVYAASSLAALVYAATRVARDARPRSLRRPSRKGIQGLARSGLPIAVGGLVETGMLSATTVLVSALQGNAAVGLLGAASRLVDGTFALSAAFAAAMAPLLARAARAESTSLRDVYAGGTRVLVAVLLPISAAFLLFADSLTRLIFGSSFEPAASAVQLLSATVLLNGVSWLSAHALIACGRQARIPWIAGIVAVQVLALDLVLIPAYSYDGAAVAILAGAVTYAALATLAAVREAGSLPLSEIAIAPLAGVGGMALLTALIGADLVVIPLAAATYVLVAGTIERFLHPADLRLAFDAVRRAR
jgi:O-antigen/teichoic acid export membrane protein